MCQFAARRSRHTRDRRKRPPEIAPKGTFSVGVVTRDGTGLREACGSDVSTDVRERCVVLDGDRRDRGLVCLGGLLARCDQVGSQQQRATSHGPVRHQRGSYRPSDRRYTNGSPRQPSRDDRRPAFYNRCSLRARGHRAGMCTTSPAAPSRLRAHRADRADRARKPRVWTKR
jgi:hypothetical protein